MKPIRVDALTEKQVSELDQLYRQSKTPRMRTRAQMVLLASEQNMVAGQIAVIVRENEETVRRWLKRYLAEGIEGLADAPRPGAAPTVSQQWRDKLVTAVRRRPRSLDLPFSLWTAQRLADYLAQETGIRVSDETVRRHLGQAGIVLSRPQHKISSPDPDYLLKKRRSSRHETTSYPVTHSTTPMSST